MFVRVLREIMRSDIDEDRLTRLSLEHERMIEAQHLRVRDAEGTLHSMAGDIIEANRTAPPSKPG